MACLGDWERFLHDDTLPPLVHSALAHSQFEAIHPFLDGNGRVGRLLITLLLVSRGVLPSPLLYLSAYFETTRDEYYARLLGVTERGEWEEWLTYFLRGVVLQSDDAVDRIQRIDDLFSQWKQGLPPGSVPGSGKGAGPLCRESLLDGAGRGQRAVGGLHNGPAGHRPAGGGGGRRSGRRRPAEPGLLRGGSSRCAGGARRPSL